jgi:REP element-mobilizing transposase RayT
MIIAWHLVWTCYGWWFPNDLRGSWSEETWTPELEELGEGHLGRKKRQPRPEVLREWLEEAQLKLKHPPFTLSGPAALAAADAIKKQVAKHGYVVHAFAAMPEHVHIVVDRHEHEYERMVNAFKSVSSRDVRKLLGMKRSPSSAERRRGNVETERDPVWSESFWVRYIDSRRQLRAAAEYVRANPVREGLPPQEWSFVWPWRPAPRGRGG